MAAAVVLTSRSPGKNKPMKKFILLVLVILWGAAMAAPQVALAWPHRQGGTPLVVDQAATGQINDESFRQIYTFWGAADEVIALTMNRVDGDLDPFLLLTDDHGTILALSDDDGDAVNAIIISKRIPADGQYFVIATRFGQELGTTSGHYTLLLEQVGESATETTALQYGDSVVGNITADAPLVFYFLRAQRGDVISIKLLRLSGDLDPLLDLATSDGLTLASNDDDPLAAGTLDAGISNYTILQTGIYLIVATRFGRMAGDTTGNYALSISQTPPDELAGTLAMAQLIDYGASVEGSIDELTPTRFYWFEAQRGDVITITELKLSGNLDPFLKLDDTNLIDVAVDDDGGGRQDARIAAFTIPVAGKYYVLAGRAGEVEGQTSGTFTLQINGRPGVAGGQALEIVYGATVSGQIEGNSTTEEYVFFGRQGDVIEITMERASGDLDPLLTLLDSDRKQIAFDDDSGDDQNAQIQQFTLPGDDMYILVASRFDQEMGQTSGAYILTLELVRSASIN